MERLAKFKVQNEGRERVKPKNQLGKATYSIYAGSLTHSLSLAPYGTKQYKLHIEYIFGLL